MNSLLQLSTASLIALSALAVPAQIKKTVKPAKSISSHGISSQSPINSSQSNGTIQINRMAVVLDPAHGGIDSGSRISDATLEKDVTLAFAFKLRSLLVARGFAVVLTRDADTPGIPGASGAPITLDDRASIANHERAVACLLIHATGSGTGVHLYKSELEATAGVPQTVPWLTAQSAWIQQSKSLQKQLATSLTRANIPIVTSSASVRPADSLSCPALVIEIAPDGSDPDSINSSAYQQRAAQAIAGSLVFWRSQVKPPFRLSSLISTPTLQIRKTQAKQSAHLETRP